MGNAVENSPGEETPQEAARRATVWLVRGMGALIVTVLVLRTCVVEGCPVTGPSMEPTLRTGERVLVFKLPTLLSRLPGLGGFTPIAPGDLLVFERPEEDRRYVKRVIASEPRQSGSAIAASDGGTQVLYEGGAVYIDNQRIDEPYVLPGDTPSPEEYAVTLSPGEYFVLGDHRSVSKDSLRFGPIDHDQVVGRAFLRYWPPSEFGLL